MICTFTYSLTHTQCQHGPFNLNYLIYFAQDLDPNEVYREDYEEDVIQNQGLKTGYNDSYNNQYQTTYYNQTDKTPYFNQNDKTPYYNQNDKQPYYNYQEDYFNEEDEYKYLEEEREEAANLEHQKQQLQGDMHQQEVDILCELVAFEQILNSIIFKIRNSRFFLILKLCSLFDENQKPNKKPIQHMSQQMQQQMQQQLQQLDKLDEYEEQDILDDNMIGDQQDEDLDDIAGGYPSDEDVALDDNKLKNQITLSKQNSKKRHLTPQESISDTEFFSQRFDGPGLKNLNKQESIIPEEEETPYPVVEPKTIPRLPMTTREVGNGQECCRFIIQMLLKCVSQSAGINSFQLNRVLIVAAVRTAVNIGSDDNNNNGTGAHDQTTRRYRIRHDWQRKFRCHHPMRSH